MLGFKPEIFAIDDDPDILELYQMTLEDSFVVTTFTNGKDAVEAGRKSGWPTIMVVDLVMPILDGLQSISFAKQSGYTGPFVVCSGQADKSRAIKALAMKAYALLEKPFDSIELNNILRHAVYEREIMRINQQLLAMNEELAENSKILIGVYEQGLVDSDHEIFTSISKRIDELNRDIELLHKEQVKINTWSEQNQQRSA